MGRLVRQSQPRGGNRCRAYFLQLDGEEASAEVGQTEPTEKPPAP